MYYIQYIFLKKKVFIHPCIFLTEIYFFSTLMIGKSISAQVSFWTDFTEKNYENFVLSRNLIKIMQEGSSIMKFQKLQKLKKI